MQTNSPRADTVNPSVQSEALKNNQFHINDVPAESGLLVGDAAVFNVAGHFCATQAKCSHEQGPLNEGKLDGSTVTLPLARLSVQRVHGRRIAGPGGHPAQNVPRRCGR
jgi:nitrite reductase/ring-hydroxylating ferredoxin subunit